MTSTYCIVSPSRALQYKRMASVRALTERAGYTEDNGTLLGVEALRVYLYQHCQIRIPTEVDLISVSCYVL